MKITPEKRIRSYNLRQSRATAGQQKAIDNLWDSYCLEPLDLFDNENVFGRKAPLIVEIGFGTGSSLATMAEANPDFNYLGIEVHRPGVAHLMMLLEEKALSNVKIYHYDAFDILEHKIADNTLLGVHLFFPDPWHKRRHHKRRIVRAEFLSLLNKKLISGGYFHAATDWEHYAKDMLRILTRSKGLINTGAEHSFSIRPSYRPLTKFENRGIRLGHGVWDLIFKKH